MKAKIRKHEGGGFVRFRPILDTTVVPTGVPTGVQESEKASGGGGGLIDENSKKMLEKGGLTSDYYKLMDELSALENSPEAFLNAKTSQQVIRSISGKINEMRNNKEDWGAANTSTQKSGAYSEVAISSDNRVFSRDKEGNIMQVNLKDYKKKPEKYNLLSLGDLLNERQNNKSLAFNNSIIKIANNSIGLKSIMDHVDGLLTTLSEFSIKKENTFSKKDIKNRIELEAALVQQTGKVPNQSQQRGIKLLLEAEQSPGDFVKVTSKTSGKGKDLNAALTYIWDTLDYGAQNKLNVTAVINGDKSGKEIIYDMLQNYGAKSYESAIEPVKASTVSTAAETSQKPKSQMELRHSGMVGKTILNWNSPITGLNMELKATSTFRLFDNNDRPFSAASIDKIFKTEESSLLDISKATVGSNLLSINDRKELIYTGELAGRVFLPVTAKGTADWTKAEQIKKVEAEILADPSLTAEEINERFYDLGLEQVQVKDAPGGRKEYIVTKNFKPFQVFHVIIGEDSDAAVGNSQLKTLTKEEKSRVLSTIQTEWKKEGVNPGGRYDWSTTLHRAIVAIPYLEDSSIRAAARNKNILGQQTTIQQAQINRNLGQASQINADPTQLFN